MHDFSKFKEKIKEIENWLKKELAAVRTGRATPAVLDAVLVPSYGGRVPLSHLASITVEDARTLRVNPWDKSQIKELETALQGANLGLAVAADNQGLRLNFPTMTGETRAVMTKLIHQKLEEARIHLRREREEIWTKIQKEEKEGKMGEDAKFKAKAELQKLVDGGNATLEKLVQVKEKEIQS